VAKIVATKGKATQGRLESFFGPSTIKHSDLAAKRKAAGPAKAAKGAKAPAAKKGKLGGVGGKKK
jgi:flap endonuclease-1